MEVDSRRDAEDADLKRELDVFLCAPQRSLSLCGEFLFNPKCEQDSRSRTFVPVGPGNRVIQALKKDKHRSRQGNDVRRGGGGRARSGSFRR